MPRRSNIKGKSLKYFELSKRDSSFKKAEKERERMTMSDNVVRYGVLLNFCSLTFNSCIRRSC